MELYGHLRKNECCCKYCGRTFESAPKHPHQTCCNSLECLRAQAREREHRCRKKRNRDSKRRIADSERKHLEYVRRKERKRLQRSIPTDIPIFTISPREVPNIILGIMQMITQETDANHLSKLVCRCQETGKALHL